MASVPASIAKREESRSAADSVKCWHCAAELLPEYFCPTCGSIQAMPDNADYFQVLGLPQKLVIDAGAMQQRYYDLHRRLHPDRFQTGPQEARVASLRNTAAVNRAYTTLRDPIDRGLYWLAVQGEALGANNNRVPTELAALVFETQEKLEELRGARTSTQAAEMATVIAEVATIRQELEQRRATLLAALQENFSRWDAGDENRLGLRHDLKQILSMLAYLGTLIRDVDKELEG